MCSSGQIFSDALQFSDSQARRPAANGRTYIRCLIWTKQYDKHDFKVGRYISFGYGLCTKPHPVSDEDGHLMVNAQEGVRRADNEIQAPLRGSFNQLNAVRP